MKHYIFTEKKKGNDFVVKVYRVKRNNAEYVTTSHAFNYSSTRGALHEAFNALMECGEIPKKYYSSSEEAAPSCMGPGYFYGKVTQKYNIKQL